MDFNGLMYDVMGRLIRGLRTYLINLISHPRDNPRDKRGSEPAFPFLTLLPLLFFLLVRRNVVDDSSPDVYGIPTCSLVTRRITNGGGFYIGRRRMDR